MPNSETLPVRYIPSQGLNTHLDPSTLPPNQAIIADNVTIDTKAIVTRPGISATTYALEVGSGYKILACSRHVSEPGLSAAAKDNTYAFVYTGSITQLMYWGGASWGVITLSAGMYLDPAATYGNFVTYRDSVYFSAPGCTPLRLKSGTGSNTAPIVQFAGPPAAQLQTKIAAWDSETGWTGPGCTPPLNCTTTLDSNTESYMVGSGGVKISLTENATSATASFTGSMAAALFTKFDSIDSDNEDYIAFYLCRHTYSQIKSITLTIGSKSVVIARKASYDEGGSTGVPSNSGLDSLIGKWNDDRSSHKMFLIKARKSWFTPTGDWGSVTTVSFTIVPVNKVTKNNPCGITVNYLHLRQSEMQLNVDCLRIANVEPGEQYTSSTGWRLSNASWDTTHQFKGANCIKLNPGGTATLLYNENQDFATFEDGQGIGGRDLIQICVAIECTTTAILTDVPITLTIGSRTFVFHMVGIGGTLNFAPRRIRSVPIALSPTGDISSVGQISISLGGSAGCVVYVDDICIKRGRYKTIVTKFDPGLVDLMTCGDDVTNWLKTVQVGPELQTIKTAAELLIPIGDVIGDAIQSFFYRVDGSGAFKFPYWDRAERGRGSLASLYLCAGGEKISLTGFASGLFDALSGTENDLDGFRFTAGFICPWKVDLKNYTTWVPFQAANTGAGYDMPSALTDTFRCWIWSKDITKVQKIKFRLYTNCRGSKTPYRNADGETVSDPAEAISLLPYWVTPDTFSEYVPSYFEYVWEAASVPTKDSWKWMNRTKSSAINEFTEDDPLAKIYKTAGGLSEQKTTFTGFGADMANKYLDGKVSTDDYLKVGSLLGAPGYQADNELFYVARWKMEDCLYVGDNGCKSWENIYGYSIEIVPNPGDSCEVAVDNWWLKWTGALAGQYSYRYTYSDSTGQEGAPSDPTDLVMVDGGSVGVSGLPTTWPAGAEALNLYRLGGTRSDWGRVGVIHKAGQQGFYDNTDDDYLGVSMMETIEAPPKSKVLGVVGDRLFYADTYDRWYQQKNSRIYISKVMQPGRCGLEDIRDLGPSDGQSITAIANWFGTALVFKTNSLWTVDSNLTAIKRSSHLGCIAPKSVAVCPGFVACLSQEGPAACTPSGGVDADFGRPVRNYMIDRIKTENPSLARSEYNALLTTAVGAYFENKYFLFFNTGTATSTDGKWYGLVYDFLVKCWTSMNLSGYTGTTGLEVRSVCTHPDGSAIYIGTGSLPTGAASGGASRLLNFWSGTTDMDSTIVGTYKSGYTDFDYGEGQKNLKTYYVRGKYTSGTTGSYTVTPLLEEILQSSSVTRSEIGNGVQEPGLLGTSTTAFHSFTMGVNGFAHGVQLVLNGPIAVSLLTGIYDRIPLRNY